MCLLNPFASRSYCKTYFFVILNEVKDLEPVENTRFFALPRMTTH
jgi:hypothetical protein